MKATAYERPLVSVITPCYNAEPWVREAIDSCLRQSYQPLEVIVVDDGSADRSLEILESYGPRIKLWSGPNRGGSAARNRGFELSSGEYLMFLDADDVIGPDTLESLVASLAGRKGCVAVCPWWRLETDGDSWVPHESGVSPFPCKGRDYISGWLTGWYVPPCAILWPRDVYERTGGWDEELTANQDGDLMMRALLDGADIVRSERGAAYYRSHGVSRISVSRDVVSEEALRSRMRVLEKVAARLEALERLDDYAVALGQAYHGLALNGLDLNVHLARECLIRAEQLAGSKAIVGTWRHRLLCRALGVERKERLAISLASIGIMTRKRRISSKLRRVER